MKLFRWHHHASQSGCERSAPLRCACAQAAALEKRRAGEGRDVEHVALQTPASERLQAGLRPRGAKSGANALAAPGPGPALGAGEKPETKSSRQPRRRARAGAAEPVAAAAQAPPGGLGLQLRKRRRVAAEALADGGKRRTRG